MRHFVPHKWYASAFIHYKNTHEVSWRKKRAGGHLPTFHQPLSPGVLCLCSTQGLTPKQIGIISKMRRATCTCKTWPFLEFCAHAGEIWQEWVAGFLWKLVCYCSFLIKSPLTSTWGQNSLIILALKQRLSMASSFLFHHCPQFTFSTTETS